MRWRRVRKGLKGLISSQSVSDEQNKPLSGSFDTVGAFDAKGSHATDNGADEVNVENGVDVYQMERDGYREESEPAETRHHREWMMTSSFSSSETVESNVG